MDMKRYLVRNNWDQSLLQPPQVDSETLPQLFEEGQVQGNPTESIKHTKHLARHSAWGEVSIACEPDKEPLLSGAGISHKWENWNVKVLTDSCDDCACKEEGAAEVPVTGVCGVSWRIYSIFLGI